MKMANQQTAVTLANLFCRVRIQQVIALEPLYH